MINAMSVREVILQSTEQTFPEHVQNAEDLWHIEFEQRGMNSLKSFAQRLCEEVGAKDKTNEFFLLLFKNNMSRVKTKQDNQSTMNVAQIASVAVTTPVIDSVVDKNGVASTTPFQAFRFLIRQYIELGLNQRLNRVDDSEHSQLVQSAVLQVISSSTDYYSVVNWLHKQSNDVHYHLSQNEMEQILHHMYVLMCEIVGPVNADQVLSNIIKKAEMLYSEAGFSPRDLL